MDDNIIGLFAESRAGHDKGKLYIIIKAGTGFALIVDGKSRTTQKPKLKNIKHLRIIKTKIATELNEKILTDKPICNEEIKYEIKKFSSDLRSSGL